MSKNDITGDALRSRTNSKAFDENFDKIFRYANLVLKRAEFCDRCTVRRLSIGDGTCWRCPNCGSEVWIG
jgi:tRNA(Ile2) C34 agmatinyltransferase TiaS